MCARHGTSRCSGSIPRCCSRSRSGARRSFLPGNIPVNETAGRPDDSHLELGRNLADLAREFPVQGSKSDHAASDHAAEFQDRMWLMAGLAEHGWTLQKSLSERQNTHASGLLTPTALQTDEERRLLQGWNPQSLRILEQEQSRYFQHGSLGSKCDVASELDPVQRGLIDEARNAELFEVYVRSKCSFGGRMLII